MVKISYLFVNEKGAQIFYEDNSVQVKYKDGMLKRIPVETLEAIYMFNYVQITTQCSIECIKRGIYVSYFSPTGKYFGRLQSTGHVNTARQRQQAKLAGTDFALQLAKNIIKGKIHNQEVVLKRYARSERKDLGEFIKSMQISERKIESCETVAEIMGYEGNAAKVYFRGLGKLVHEEFAFSGRSKHPPQDEFNSMLSLGYSLLMNEIYGRLENKGLNPYFGFIHSDKEKHPTLASDIMEEWRAPIVDSMVMSMVNGHEIHKEHFSNDVDEPGFYLTRDGLNIFLKKYNRKMQSDVNYLDYINYRVSYRRAIDLQINELTKAIETEDASVYHPIRLR